MLNSNTKIEIWLQQNTTISKIIATVFIITSFIILVNIKGLGSAFFFWLITLLTCLSLLVIISPLKQFNYKHFIAFFLISFLIEFIL